MVEEAADFELPIRKVRFGQALISRVVGICRAIARKCAEISAPVYSEARDC
jgi:hypothetical protein